MDGGGHQIVSRSDAGDERPVRANPHQPIAARARTASRPWGLTHRSARSVRGKREPCASCPQDPVRGPQVGRRATPVMCGRPPVSVFSACRRP